MIYLRSRHTIATAMAVAALVITAPAAWSQATASGTIVGTVVDVSKAAVVNATATATNTGTNLSRTAATNQIGEYRFDQLPVGTYTIRITAKGFATQEIGPIELLVGNTATASAEMKPGSEAQVVQVMGQGQSVIDTENTSVATTFSPKEIQDLPLNGRDFANLAFLAPGVKPVDSYDPTKNRYAVYAVDGSGGRNTNTTVNGIDNKDNTVGGAVMQLPLEAVQEFKISTQRFSAANGRSEGAALNVVTKSGSNQFHGSAYAFVRSQTFQTPDAFTDGVHKPSYHRIQAGGSVGGPIRRDKDFGFFAYEKTRVRESITVDPTSFAELTLAQPIGAAAVRTIPTPYDDKRYNGRVDHVFNDRNKLYINYLAQDNTGQNDQSGSQNDLSAGNYTLNDLILTNAALTSVISPSVVNNLTFGYQYWNNLINTKNFSRTITFPGGEYFGTNGNVPQQSYQGKFQFRDDLSITRGKHSMSTGVDVVYMPKFGGFFEFTPVPEFDFLQDPSTILGDPATYPQGFATPGLIGAIAATSGNAYFDLPKTVKFYGAYFEDDWKPLPNLTLNLGVRYDKDAGLLGQTKQRQNRTFQELAAIGSPVASDVAHTDNLDFSPRLGFAYDIFGTGKHVLRGGYGIYFGQTFLNIPLFMIQQTNPTIFATVLSLSSSGPDDTSADPVPSTGKRLSQYQYGVDAVPPIPAPPTELPAGSRGRTIDPHYRNPYTEQFNLGYAWEVWSKGAITFEGVHTFGVHDNKQVNINPRDYRNGGKRPLAAAFAAAGVPVLADVRDMTAGNKAFYDALNVSYRQIVSHNLSVNTNVVWSHGLSYEGAAADYADTPTFALRNALAPQDYGTVPSNEGFRWVFSGIYTAPLGIQFAPIVQMATARPYDGNYGSFDYWSQGSGHSNDHLVVPTGSPKDYTTYSTATGGAIRDCLAAGACLEQHYNSFRGKPFTQIDLRVSKDIHIWERLNMNVFFQGFNITDRSNFGANYSGNPRSSSFQQPVGFITPSGTIVPHSFTGEFGARLSF